MDLGEIDWEDVIWMHLTRDYVQWGALVSILLNFFPDFVSRMQLIAYGEIVIFFAKYSTVKIDPDLIYKYTQF
jgi:hypothetical protein